MNRKRLNTDKIKRKKVLVLGFSAQSFLSVIRSLGRAGIEVHIAWHKEDGWALSSRYISKVHLIPPYRPDSEDWKTALIALMKTYSFDLVIPCHDETVVPLQRHREELERHGRIYTVSDQSFEILFDKIKTNRLARELGVNVPREIILEKADLEKARSKLAAAGLGFPLILKPHTSYSGRGLFGENPERTLVKRAETIEDLERFLEELAVQGPVAVQEFFAGKGVGVNFLCQEGRPLLVFQQERVHEPQQGGSGTYRKSTAVSPELREASLKILSALKYTGVAMAEFKVNQQTGQWVLIEINARFWGSLPLALSAGADFPLALFELLTEGKISVRPDYRPGLYSRNLTEDIAWQLKNLRADHRDPTLLTIPVHRVILRDLINIFTLRDRIDTLAWDDPKPFWAEIRALLLLIRGKLQRKIHPKIVSLPFIARRRRQKLKRLALQSRSVLFVCHGNVCRSPFAEHLLKSLTSQKVQSAGFLPPQGRFPPAEAVTAASRHGIDLSGHASKIVTPKMVLAADLIFVFDYDNYSRLLRAYPQAKKKVFFLGWLLPGKTPFGNDPFIADPWGKGSEAYALAYHKIKQAISYLARIAEQF